MEIVVHGFDEGPIFFPANTWIHSCKDNPDDRIIFRNQVSVVYQGFFFSLLNFCVSFCLRDVHVVVYRHIYHHKHHLGLKIYGVRTCSAFVEMERARESLMIEFMIMLFIMIWVILTRMKNLLDRPWAVRSGLILGAVELVDLQPRKVQCSPENFIWTTSWHFFNAFLIGYALPWMNWFRSELWNSSWKATSSVCA